MGLFVDRLDVGVVDGGQNDTVRLVPYAHAVYQMRNRAYVPALGRFLQPDPNASAMALIESSAYHGRGMGALSLTLDMEGMYGDGMNLYEYLGSSPWQRSDPLGLSWDPFSIVDDYLAESTGAAAAMLSALGKDLAAVALVTAQIASYLPFPAAGVAGELALYALGEQGEGQLAIALGMGLVPGGKLAQMFARSKLGSFLGKLGASAWRTATGYASRFAARVGGIAGGLMDRARNLLRRKPAAACGCFAAGTLVWTTVGLVPIEHVQRGDTVLARDEATGQLLWREVTQQIVTRHAALLDVTLVHESGERETLRTTDEHPFWVTGRGWVRADALRVGDAAQTAAGRTARVEAISFTGERTTVYNLSVDGDHNYFVGPDGVWVHNCWEGLHHLIPKYMRGAAEWATTRLTHAQHVELHSLIDHASRARGIPTRTQGAKKLNAWLRADPMVRVHELREALVEAYGAYDIRNGTSLLTELMAEMRKRSF